jgi:hypothetical protein
MWADIVSERIQGLSKKEFALGGPMDIGLRMSEDTISANLHVIHEIRKLEYLSGFFCLSAVNVQNR